MPIRCVVLFAKDYFLLRAKAISGKERLADQHKGLMQKIFGVNQGLLNMKWSLTIQNLLLTDCLVWFLIRH